MSEEPKHTIISPEDFLNGLACAKKQENKMAKHRKNVSKQKKKSQNALDLNQNGQNALDSNKIGQNILNLNQNRPNKTGAWNPVDFSAVVAGISKPKPVIVTSSEPTLVDVDGQSIVITQSKTKVEYKLELKLRGSNIQFQRGFDAGVVAQATFIHEGTNEDRQNLVFQKQLLEMTQKMRMTEILVDIQERNIG